MKSQSFSSSFCHCTLHIRLQKQVLHSDFYLTDMVNSHYMADVGTCQTIQLLYLLCGIIAVIVHEVSPAQFFKMLLGIIGTTILTLCRYLIAVGVCPKCRLAHRKGCLHLISRHPFRDAVEVNGCFENLPF